MDEMVVPAHKRHKHKGKLDEDPMDLNPKIIEHTLSEDALAEHFPEGYKRLPDEVYKNPELIPAVFEKNLALQFHHFTHSSVCRTKTYGVQYGRNQALHDIKKSHYQLQTISDRTFRKGKTDKQLQCLFRAFSKF